MNNTPDYNDDLAFKPELTWEELWKYAEKKGAKVDDGCIIFNQGCSNLVFSQYGCIQAFEGNIGVFVAEGLIYEQMKTIIEALWG